MPTVSIVGTLRGTFGLMAISSYPAELMTVSKTHSLLIEMSHLLLAGGPWKKEEGQIWSGRNGAQEKAFRLPQKKEWLRRTCQDVVRGAEQGPLLISHPCALRGQMTKSW